MTADLARHVPSYIPAKMRHLQGVRSYSSAQRMAAVMAAKNEAFRGTEQVPEKVTIYNQFRAHAAAIAKTLRTPMHADSLELREQNALIYVEFSLPVSILNDSIRNRLSELFRLADMVTFAEANGRIRISFSVANVWKA